MYLVDYATRVLVMTACFVWPIGRAIAQETLPIWRIDLAIVAVVVLPIIGRLLHNYVDVPFVELTGLTGLFQFGKIENSGLYWVDLSLGLLLVALSEELIFRKIALSWLRSSGKSTLQIILISACFFALIHWGNGPGGVLYTFGLGLFYMAFYLKIGRLWPLVVTHWIENFIAFGPW